MRFTRALNQLICRVLIGLVLFAQFAVASYACPTGEYGSAHAPVHALEQVVDAASHGAGDLDHKAPNLCAEHCKTGQQANDASPAPVIAQPTPGLFYVLTGVEADTAGAQAVAATDPLLDVPPPPHAILHCVLRT
ncbi:hypothetical protein [Roseateles saccharophilus]|uniref:Uncharacterized protein n=1 Tax=Roseateles saccharophilus TaxID=304 RepID=A0A4R3VKS0_ROSSA|nr:hypothetical protein [Roseateles saccharophilus]MDG0831301.1 hypothetical protein [Roseateles saccharophilus]TCV04429.1 hypothetical protein EV671_1001184 [Roseateles saccharophilus]